MTSGERRLKSPPALPTQKDLELVPPSKANQSWFLDELNTTSRSTIMLDLIELPQYVQIARNRDQIEQDRNQGFNTQVLIARIHLSVGPVIFANATASRRLPRDLNLEMSTE